MDKGQRILEEGVRWLGQRLQHVEVVAGIDPIAGHGPLRGGEGLGVVVRLPMELA